MGEHNPDEGRNEAEGDDVEGQQATSGSDSQDDERSNKQTDGAGTAEADAVDADLREPDLEEYWRRNVRLIAGLFVVWFVVSFLAAILLANPLQSVQIGTLPLPFWFAQQGSIIVFVLIIFVYVRRMNELDREFGVED